MRAGAGGAGGRGVGGENVGAVGEAVGAGAGVPAVGKHKVEVDFKNGITMTASGNRDVPLGGTICNGIVGQTVSNAKVHTSFSITYAGVDSSGDLRLIARWLRDAPEDSAETEIVVPNACVPGFQIEAVPILDGRSVVLTLHVQTNHNDGAADCSLLFWRFTEKQD